MAVAKKSPKKEAPPPIPGKAPAPQEKPAEGNDGKQLRNNAGIAWLTAVVVATGGITAFYSVRSELGEERIAHAVARHDLDTSRSEVAALQARIAELTADRERLAQEAREKAEALEAMQRTQKELEERLQQEIAKGSVLISQQQGELVVDVLDKIVFDSGKAELNERGKKVLRQVGETLSAVPDKVILVAGHTDGLPISDKLVDKFPTNWELSTARATNVVRFLQEELGIPGKRLAAVGYAEFRPVATNRTKAGRSRNRRIEVRLLPLQQGRR